MIIRTQNVQMELEPISILRRPIQIPRNPTSFVNESYAKEGTNGHDWTLESVHKELLLGGNYASVLGHQWHIVAEQDQYGDWIGVEVTLPSWRNIELSKESDAKN
jgi:hypothetical protein